MERRTIPDGLGAGTVATMATSTITKKIRSNANPESFPHAKNAEETADGQSAESAIQTIQTSNGDLMISEPSNVVRMTGPSFYEQQSRQKKVQRVVSFMLSELANMLERPENAAMFSDAALAAGVNDPSAESRALIIELLREKAK